MAASRSPDMKAGDAVRWWQAYQLADRDQADELRKLAAAGDDHARRQLASWLAERAFPYAGPDRARLGEAIEAIRPLADAGDDVAELWLASWLADCDRLAELRERADSGSYHAARKLPCLLVDHDRNRPALSPGEISALLEHARQAGGPRQPGLPGAGTASAMATVCCQS